MCSYYQEGLYWTRSARTPGELPDESERNWPISKPQLCVTRVTLVKKSLFNSLHLSETVKIATLLYIIIQWLVLSHLCEQLLILPVTCQRLKLTRIICQDNYCTVCVRVFKVKKFAWLKDLSNVVDCSTIRYRLTYWYKISLLFAAPTVSCIFFFFNWNNKSASGLTLNVQPDTYNTRRWSPDLGAALSHMYWHFETISVSDWVRWSILVHIKDPLSRFVSHCVTVILKTRVNFEQESMQKNLMKTNDRKDIFKIFMAAIHDET